MKHIVRLIVVVLLCLTVLCSCSNNKTESGNRCYVIIDDITFVRVPDDCRYFDILVHKETKVMYIETTDSYQGGLAVLLDADGKPMLWEGEL